MLGLVASMQKMDIYLLVSSCHLFVWLQRKDEQVHLSFGFVQSPQFRAVHQQQKSFTWFY